MIALFDEPPRVTIKLRGIGNNGMLIGMAIVSGHPGETLKGVVVTETGEVTLLPTDTFTVDWRYNAETDEWSDVNHKAEADQPV